MVRATKSVVVGVDNSEQALRAVEWAALEARQHGSSLRIVSAPTELPRMHAYHASSAEIAVGIRDPEDVTGRRLFAFEEAAQRGVDLIAIHA